MLFIFFNQYNFFKVKNNYCYKCSKVDFKIDNAQTKKNIQFSILTPGSFEACLKIEYAKDYLIVENYIFFYMPQIPT